MLESKLETKKSTAPSFALTHLTHACMKLYVYIHYSHFCFIYISSVGKLRTRHLMDYSDNNNANSIFLIEQKL